MAGLSLASFSAFYTSNTENWKGRRTGNEEREGLRGGGGGGGTKRAQHWKPKLQVVKS